MFPVAADEGTPKRQRFVTCERQNAVDKFLNASAVGFQ
jgi:hypothetical protein